MINKDDYYYPETIRKTIEATANVFSDMTVFKYDKDNNKMQQVNIPLSFGPPEAESKVTDNGVVEQYTPQIPRIDLIWNGLSLADDRVISPLNDRYWNEKEVIFEDPDVDPTNFLTQINGLFKDQNPLPYDYSFTVKLVSGNLNYLSQMLENILPRFYPKNTGMIRVKEFSFLNVERDLVMSMGGVSVDMPSDQSFEDNRTITAEFDLTIEGFIYQRIHGSKLVKTVLMDFFANDLFDKEVEQPGNIWRNTQTT